MILRSVYLKVLLATFLLGGMSKVMQAQRAVSTDSVYTFVDTMPQFPGGNAALLDTVLANLEFTENVGSSLQSKFIIQYTVEKDGSVSDISVNARRKEEEDAFKKVFFKLKFEPGKLNGRSVRVRMMIPIHISYR
jgi:protein TonB